MNLFAHTPDGAPQDTEQQLFLYLHDELPPEARVALEQRLAADPLLRHQLAALRRDLQRIDEALQPPALDERFEDRLWQRLEPRLVLVADDLRGPPALSGVPVSALPARTQPAMRVARRTPRPWAWLAWAASVVLAVGAGLWWGQRSSTLSVDGERVLSAELSRHLRGTEQVFLLAQHSPDQAQLAAELARGLVDTHRLYAAAAERAGRPQLAHLLRDMEPLLLELATSPAHTVDHLLQQAIADADLPFKARSAAWAVQHTPVSTMPGRP